MTPCSMHPTRSAHWHCPKCKQDFCTDCVIKQKAGAMGGERLIRSCPKCLVETRWIGAEEVIAPFWERLPRFFIYPLAPAPMIYMAVLALGSLVYWSWMVQFVCWVFLLNYAYLSLRKTAQGDLMPPPADEMLADKFMNMAVPVVKQALLFFVLIVAGMFVIRYTGIAGGILYLAAALFLLPSMIIVLVNTLSLRDALNPAAFLALPFKIGKGYLVMFVFLAILLGAPGALLSWFVYYLPPAAGAYLTALAENYYTIVSYHLMGYVLLQYHEEIGYEIEVDDIKSSSKKEPAVPDDPGTRAAKIVAVRCREGDLDGAIEHIRYWREKGGNFSPELARQYFYLLKNEKNEDGMLAHAPVFLDFAVSEGNKKEALEAYDACRAIDKKFSPASAVLFKIGEWMAEAGRFKDALKIFSRLVKTHPDADEVPLSYFRAAQLCHERFMDPARARKIMKTLVEKFPDHAMSSRFRAYMEHIGA